MTRLDMNTGRTHRARLTGAGHLRLPREVRTLLALHGGNEIDIRLDGDRVVLRPATHDGGEPARLPGFLADLASHPDYPRLRG